MEEGGVLECAGLFDADVEVVVDICDLRGRSVMSTLASNLFPVGPYKNPLLLPLLLFLLPFTITTRLPKAK